MSTPKTYTSLAEIDEGGRYEFTGGVYVRVQEPTVEPPGAAPLDSLQGAEGGLGVAVGAASGTPPAPLEAGGDEAPQ